MDNELGIPDFNNLITNKKGSNKKASNKKANNSKKAANNGKKVASNKKANNSKKAASNKKANNTNSGNKSVGKKIKSIVESLGAEDIEQGLKENAPGYLVKANSKIKLTKKYRKECSENEEQYNKIPSSVEFKSYRDGFKKVKPTTLLENDGFGLILPALSILDFSIFVDKQQHPKCYRKKPKNIPKDSVYPGGICYKTDQCIDGVCEDNLFGVVEGKCRQKRNTINVEEGELCANTTECKPGLECNTWGFGLGECKKKK